MPQDQNPDRQITLEEFEENRRRYYGLPRGMTEALKTQESGGRQYDQTGGVLTSPKQARGRYQVLKSTAAKYGLDPDDPYENVEASFRYLSELNKQVDAKVADPGERWAQTLAGYHAGEGRLREVNKTGALPSTSDGLIRTDDYVANIMNRWQQHDRGKAQPATPQPKPQKPPLDPARTQRLGEMSTNFEALKRQGAKNAATELAGEIRREFGDVMEVGADRGGWPYVKPKAGSGIAYDPKKLVPSKPFTPEEAEAASRQVKQKAAAPAPGSFAGAVHQFVQPVIKGAAGFPEGFAEWVTATFGGDPEEVRQSREAIRTDLRPITERGAEYAERVFPVDPTDEGWLSAKIPRAAGSTVIPVAASLLLRSPVGGAVTGASLNAQEVAREFDAAGVDPSRRDRAIQFAGATGLTEMLGVTRALSKFGLSRPFVRRAVDVLEEGGQEALQQYLNNVNAALVGAYDPNRPFSKDVLESAILGGIVGGGVQGLSAGAARLRQDRARAPQVTQPQIAPPEPAPAPTTAPRAVAPRPEEDKGLEIVRYVDQVAQIENAPISTEDREAATEAAREEYRARRRGELSPEVQANLTQPSPFFPQQRTEGGAIFAPPSPIAARRALPPATGEEIIPPQPPQSRAVMEVISRPDPRFVPGQQPAQPTQPIPAPPPAPPLTKTEQGAQQRNRTIIASRGVTEQARQQAEAAEAEGRLEDAREGFLNYKKALSDLRGLIPRKTPGDIKLRNVLGRQMNQIDSRVKEINEKIRQQRRTGGRRAKPIDPNAPTADLPGAPLLGSVVNPEGGVPAEPERASGIFGALARKQERGEGEAQDNVRIINRIRQLGGINPAGLYTGELRSAVDKRYPGLINRRDGVKPDTLIEYLAEEGYPVDRNDLDTLFRAIDDDIAGKKVYPISRSRTEALEEEASEYYARQEEELRRQEAEEQGREAAPTSDLQAPQPSAPRTERLRVPKATPENIERHRDRLDELSRLEHDRGERLTGDLAHERQELGSRIAEFENEQAKAERGGRPEEAPPAGARIDDRPFAQPTAEDRRRAFEAAEARLGDEIKRATDSLPTEDAEALERGVAAIDQLFEAAEEDADVANLYQRAIEGDTDAETEFRVYADRRHGIDADTLDSIIDTGRNARDRRRVGQRTQARPTPSRTQTGDARYGADRTPVEAAPQAQALSAENLELLSTDPAEITLSAEAGLDANVEAFDRQYLDHLEDLRNRQIRGLADVPEWAQRQMDARLKQALEVRRQHVKDKLLPARYQPMPPKAKPLSKEEGGRRLVEQAKKKAEEPPTVTHPNPEIDRKPIIAKTQDGRVIVPNEENKGGVSVVKDRSDEPTDYKFSSTQVNLPKEIADQIIDFGKRIPDADLADDGRESEPHITVKFGLHGSDPKFVQDALKGEGPATVKFGKVSLFETNDEFDVVKVDVESADLHRLNKKVAESQPVTDTHPGYKPHATIAYVKKGRGAKYVGNNFLEGQTATLDSVAYSGRDGEKVEIPLGRKEATPPSPGPTRPLVTNPLSGAAVKDRKRLIGKLMPFNIQGNKADLLAKGLGGVIERAAKGAKRIIDAFGGTGAYTHYLRSKGLGHEGDILNEFDPLRFITHKQLKENPKEVAREAARTLTEVRQILKGVNEGERFTEKHETVRRQVADYFQRRLNSLVAPGENVRQKARSGEPVEMRDAPETAGLYLILQNQSFNFLPVQAEVSDDRIIEEQGRFFSAPLKEPRFRLPGFGVISNEGGKVGLFAHGKSLIFETAERAESAGQRMKGVDVRRGDGWELVRKEAGKGDFVPVDTSYLNRPTGEETSNYNIATAEDAVPEVYMEKVRTNLLPAWDRGAKLVVTNNWDNRVADFLRSLGFDVVKATRQGASKEDIQSGGAAELVAINFDKKTGAIFRRPAEREDRPMASVQRGQGQVTDTLAFKRWFRGSKVVDEQGRPLVVYHGTRSDVEITAFRDSFDDGIFFTSDPEYANQYTDRPDGGQGAIYPVYLSIQNPYIWSGISAAIGDTNVLKEQGYDGVFFIGKNGKLLEITAFHKNQIKSATGNRGTFDPTDPSIMASVQRGGAATQERSEYWGTPPVPRTPSGFIIPLTEDQKAEHFEYSRAEFRQHATRARVYTNEQGAFSYAVAGNKVSGGRDIDSLPIAVDGLAVPIKTARKMTTYLLGRIAEQKTPARKDVYNNLAYALEQAVRAAERRGDKAVTIVNTESRMPRTEGGSFRSFRATRQVATHEETHVWEIGVGGPMGRGLFSDEAIISDPDYDQQRKALIRMQYPPNMRPTDVSAEAVAHVVAGQWRDLGYKSEDDAMKYLARVFDRVYSELGADALRSLRLRTPKSKEIREDVQERRISGGMGRGARADAPARTDAGGEVPRTSQSLRGREGGGRRPGEGAEGKVPRAQPRDREPALASVQRGGFTPTPNQSGVRKGYVRATDASGKTFIVEKKQAGVAAPRATAPQPAPERARPLPKQAAPQASQRSTPEQQALFELPRRESSGRDVSWYDYLASPLSNLNYKGTYERLAGETGREISEAFRQAQQAIAKDQESRGKEIAQLERTLRGYQKQLRAEGKPGLANWLDAHVAALQDPDSAFKGVVGFLKKFQYDFKLRHNPRSIIVNFLQPLQTLWPHLSTAEFAKISARARQKETRERVAELAARESGGKTEDVDRRKKRWLPDIFGKVSESNRIMGHLAGELMADKLGLIGAAKARMAADWAAKVEFDNSRWNVPPLFRGRAASVIGQFKAFTVKNLERLYADWKAQPEGSTSGTLARRAKMVTAQLALGGVRSLLLPFIKEIGGVLILGGLARAFMAAGMDDDEADKWAEAVYFGAPGLVEQDLSSSVMLLDSPYGNTPSEKGINFLGGPTISLVFNAWKEGETMATAKDSRESTRGEKIKASALRLSKAVTPYTKFGQTAYSLATTGKPPKLRLGKEEVEMTKKEAIGYGLMGTPLRQTRHYEREEAFDWQKQMLGEPTIERLPGDTDKTYQGRAKRVEMWTKRYEAELLRQPRYKRMSESQQQAALETLRRRIGTEANQRQPDLSKLSAGDVIRSTVESAARKPARDRRKIVVARD